MNTPLREGPTRGQGKELPFILAGAAGRLPADLPFPGTVGRKDLGKKARVGSPSEFVRREALVFRRVLPESLFSAKLVCL